MVQTYNYYKTLLKEFKEDLNKWKDIHINRLQDLNVKMAILIKSNYIFKAIPIRIQAAFGTEIEKLIIKLIWKYKRPQIP